MLLFLFLLEWLCVGIEAASSCTTVTVTSSANLCDALSVPNACVRYSGTDDLLLAKLPPAISACYLYNGFTLTCDEAAPDIVCPKSTIGTVSACFRFDGRYMATQHIEVTNCSTVGGGGWVFDGQGTAGVHIALRGLRMDGGNMLARPLHVSNISSLVMENIFARNGKMWQLDVGTWSGGGCVILQNIRLVSVKNVSMRNCFFTTSSNTHVAGGGMFLSGVENGSLEDVSITDTKFDAKYPNVGLRHGGGCLGIVSSTVRMKEISVSRCSANVLGDGGGGCIFIYESNISMTDVTADSCTTALRGGGMFLFSSRANLTNVTVRNASSNDGGCFATDNVPSITIVNSTFEDCTSGGRGGAMAFAQTTEVANINMTQLTIRNATAKEDGGCVYFDDAPGARRYWYGNVTVQNSALEGCTSGRRGGAIYGLKANVFLTQLTIRKSVAQLEGGCVAYVGRTVGALLTTSLVVSSSLFEDCNSSVTGGGMNIDGGHASIRNVTVRRSSSALGSCVFYNQSRCPDCDVRMSEGVVLESCDGGWPVAVSCPLCGGRNFYFQRPSAPTCWFPGIATDGCNNTKCNEVSSSIGSCDGDPNATTFAPNMTNSSSDPPSPPPTNVSTIISTPRPRYKRITADYINADPVSSTALAGATLAALMSGGGGDAARASTILTSLECVPKLDFVLTWPLDPVSINIGGNKVDNAYLGAAIMNIALIVAVLAATGLATLTVSHFQQTPLAIAAGTAKFPGLASAVDNHFKQVILSSFGFVVWYDDRAGLQAVCALVAIAYCTAGAAFLWIICFRWVPVKAIFINGRWHDRSPHNGFVEMFGFAFSSFREGCVWFAFVDYFIIFCFGIVASVTPLSTDHCTTNAVIFTTILVGKLFLNIRYRPRVVNVVNTLSICGISMECLGAALGIVRHVAFSGPDSSSVQAVAAWSVLVSSLFAAAAFLTEAWVRRNETTAVVEDEQEMKTMEEPLFSTAFSNPASPRIGVTNPVDSADGGGGDEAEGHATLRRATTAAPRTKPATTTLLYLTKPAIDRLEMSL